MATIVLGAIGTLIGGPIGGAIGSLIGSAVDSRIFAPGPREGPRLNELKITTSSYGMAIPRHFGRMRVPGQIIWSTDLVEHKESQGGGKGSPSVTTYSYTASFAVALSSRPLLSVGRVWADGKLLRGAGGDLKVGGRFRFHAGYGDQRPDPLIAAAEGASRCPAYRGTAYVVFEDLDLSDYGNRIPSLSFEVIGDDGPLCLSTLLDGTVPNSSAPILLEDVAGWSMEGSIADTIAALQPLMPIDVDASDSGLLLSAEAGEAPFINLGAPSIASTDGDFGRYSGFTRHRGAEPEAPVRVLRYYDLERDFQPGSQRANGPTLPGQPRTVELPAALSASSARNLIEQAAKRANWKRQAISWRVTELDPEVRPGATVALPDQPGLWRVRSWEWREGGIELSLTRMAQGGAGIWQRADSGRAIQATDIAIGKTSLAVCELPWDGTSSTVPQVLVVASSESTGWHGASLYLDRGDGALEPLGATGRSRGRIGTALNAVPSASPLLFDRHSILDVALAGPDLSLTGATMRQLAMGANRAVVGEEIIQFAVAQPIGLGRWRLSGLWRGRGGTEGAVAQHQAGERFILLDGTGIVLDPALAGNVAQGEVHAIGVADLQAAVAPIAMRGIGSRPPRPVHAHWSRLEDGTVRLAWTRRARGAWLWPDGVDAPLGEQAESYWVTFASESAIHASWITDKPELPLASPDLARLLARHHAGQFFVRQRGDKALSEALSIPPPNF